MKGKSRTLTIPIKQTTAKVFDALFTASEKIMEPGVRVIRMGETFEMLVTISKPENYNELLFEEKTREIQGVVEKLKKIIE